MMTKRCPECGAEMLHHKYGDRVYYVCKRCGKELVIPLHALI